MCCVRVLPGSARCQALHQQETMEMEVTVPNEDKCREVKVLRRALPVACIKASTLHVLQGTTTDPGLIFHWVFPRPLKEPLRWLAIYVALSRVRRLKNLRSIGLNKDIRRIMEAGPPGSRPAQSQRLCREKEVQTALDADAAMAVLGWV